MTKVLIFLTGLVLSQCTTIEAQQYKNVKVAFIGDQGFGRSSTEVLKLIKSEGAELVVHQGDFDYLDNPSLWERNINRHLGESFPYVASAGNHDKKKWYGKGGYQKRLDARVAGTPGLECEGEHGVNGHCVYKNILILTSGIGSIGKGNLEDMTKVFDQSSDHLWKICSWHKQQKSYQVGSKGSSVPWDYYRLCRENGAIIAQGHEHSYSRSHTMKNFENIEVVDTSRELKVGQGMSFAFTNGLGGASVRKQELCKKQSECKHWGSIYTRNQKAKAGALFCQFYADGKKDLAQCYFKNIKGEIIDEFDIVSLL